MTSFTLRELILFTVITHAIQFMSGAYVGAKLFGKRTHVTQTVETCEGER